MERLKVVGVMRFVPDDDVLLARVAQSLAEDHRIEANRRASCAETERRLALLSREHKARAD